MKLRLIPTIAALSVLALTGCGEATGTPGAPAPGAGSEGGGSGNSGAAAPADGGIVQIDLGQPVEFKQLALSDEDIARVTITGWEYRLGEDFAPYTVKDPLPQEGMLVIDVLWETAGGSTQSNTSYFQTEGAGSEDGYRLTTALDDRLKNGRVPQDEPRTGKVGFAIDRGPTIVYITDGLGNRMARVEINSMEGRG